MSTQSEIFAKPPCEQIAEGAFLLRAYFSSEESEVIRSIKEIEAVSPFRHMLTRGGFRMSVAMTNSGRLGWVSDRSGYRYTPDDPVTGMVWPPIPDTLLRLAVDSAASAGYPSFQPDVCLINRYEPGAKMSLHQDKDEQDFSQPIVSFSLGLPATFLFGGMQRADRPARISLNSGDVVVWGGASRLAFHGIAPLSKGEHPGTGAFRFNLTFRRS